MADSDLLYTPVRSLAAQVKSKKLTSVKLTETCLERLDTLGPKLNAVVTVMRESALAEARAADAEIAKGKYRGPLHGIPYGVKDLLATKGVPTTWGAEPYRNQVFDHDATVVKKLREAGAVLCAKLAMVELAGGMGYNHADASFTGPGLTPWNTHFWSGGSSSGPGAAVAAGLVPFAIGSETSGSILTPSAYSGVTGLRPTYGLVSGHGAHRRRLRDRALRDRGARSAGRELGRPALRLPGGREDRQAPPARGAQGMRREGAARGARELQC